MAFLIIGFITLAIGIALLFRPVTAEGTRRQWLNQSASPEKGTYSFGRFDAVILLFIATASLWRGFS